jgi:hypothetical protein
MTLLILPSKTLSSGLPFNMSQRDSDLAETTYLVQYFSGLVRYVSGAYLSSNERNPHSDLLAVKSPDFIA